MEKKGRSLNSIKVIHAKHTAGCATKKWLFQKPSVFPWHSTSELHAHHSLPKETTKSRPENRRYRSICKCADPFKRIGHC